MASHIHCNLSCMHVCIHNMYVCINYPLQIISDTEEIVGDCNLPCRCFWEYRDKKESGDFSEALMGTARK